jgi:hypothetical protein
MKRDYNSVDVNLEERRVMITEIKCIEDASLESAGFAAHDGVAVILGRNQITFSKFDAPNFGLEFLSPVPL